MEIYTFGVGGRMRACESALKADMREARYRRLVLLPIPTTRDKKYITGTGTPLSDVLPLADKDVLVVGYNIPDELGIPLSERGAEIYDAALDESFLSENAEVTARGAIGHILCDSLKDICDRKIGIIGYGRIGRALLRALLFLGADVKVYTTSRERCIMLCEMGVCATFINCDTDFLGIDLLINTAPARIIPDEEVGRICRYTKIMDLASGKIFPDITGVQKLASIPDAMYPESAGKIYAEHIKAHLYPCESDLG